MYYCCMLHITLHYKCKYILITINQYNLIYLCHIFNDHLTYVLIIISLYN